MSIFGNWGVPHSVHLPPTSPRIIRRLRHSTLIAVWVGASARMPISVFSRSRNLRNWVWLVTVCLRSRQPPMPWRAGNFSMASVTWK